MSFWSNELNYTGNAAEVLARLASNPDFEENEGDMIYESLQEQVSRIKFCDYLKRYIYQTRKLTKPFHQISDDDYKKILLAGLKESNASLYFDPLITSTKEGQAITNWLTRPSVSRNAVFLLDFALEMSADDVNMFLTKALCEQEINAKIPAEVISWYCYQKHYDYTVYQALTWQYEELQPSDFVVEDFNTTATVNIRNTMFAIDSDEQLMRYLSGLKASTGISQFSRTAKGYFDQLYTQTKKQIAAMLSGVDWADEDLKENNISWESISSNQVEEVIYAGIPQTKDHNLQKEKDSTLYDKFPGTRLHKGRIQKLLGDVKSQHQETEVSRYDLITLNFFLYSRKLEEYEDPEVRTQAFVKSTNQILKACFMQPLIVQNPYENFVLSCMYNEDPLSAFSAVWEMSYNESAK